MDKVCDYCQCQYDDSLDTCPHCGAPNDYVRRGDSVPKTIEELKDWYVKHNLPAEEITRFFIGKNITEPRAFGIYKDENTGDFVVYKNKDNGSRAERYRGGDESYAVNELYLKLKEEINNQKNSAENIARRNGYAADGQSNNYRSGNGGTSSDNVANKSRKIKKWVSIAIIIIVCWHLFGGLLGMAFGCTRTVFNAFSGSDYYYSEDYDYDDSDSYSDSGSSSSRDDDDDDWDSGSSWDSSDSWDSGSSDWGSDW